MTEILFFFPFLCVNFMLSALCDLTMGFSLVSGSEGSLLGKLTVNRLVSLLS